jgi:hypothetical protein
MKKNEKSFDFFGLRVVAQQKNHFLVLTPL